MTIKLSVDEALLKARSYVKKDKIAKAQKLYQIVLDDYSKQAKDIKKGIEPLKKSKQTIAKQNPSHEQLNNLFNYYKNGRLTEAERLATFITQEFPKNHFGWTMLGAVLTQLGRNSEAVKANQTAVALSPQDPESHYNLGNTLQKLGMLNEAEASYLNVISLKPNYAEVYNNYGNMLLKLGRLGDAEENFKQAIELKPEYTEAQYNLGIVLHQLSKFDESIKHLKLAIKHNPNFIKGRISLSTVCHSAVPGWHIPMMNDKERNNAYAEAIKLAINDGAFVLDIGTGSGLLSMMAASSGAGKVITCETSKTIADVAKQIISCNGFEEKISVLNKKSTDLIVGQDLPQRADLIISEVLSSEFVGEGVRITSLDARKRLLKEGGTIIPQSGKIRVSLIGNSSEVYNATTLDCINGFDMSKFNSISKNKFGLSLRDKPLFLSEPKDAFDISLSHGDELLKEDKQIKLQVNQDGLCLGIIQWLWVHLYKDIEYENKPGENNSHWMTPVYRFDEPIMVKVGDVLHIRAILGDDNVWFYKLS